MQTGLLRTHKARVLYSSPHYHCDFFRGVDPFQRRGYNVLRRLSRLYTYRPSKQAGITILAISFSITAQLGIRRTLREPLAPRIRSLINRPMLRLIEKAGPLSDFDKLMLIFALPILGLAALGLLLFLLCCVLLCLVAIFKIKIDL